VYIALGLAIALVLRRGDGGAVIGGVVLGVAFISAYSLATRLFPDHIRTSRDAIESARLAEPIGYWNSLGLLAAIGVLTALGFAAHAQRLPLAMASAAVIPIAGTTLYFTFSRGAWMALIVGFVAAVVADPRRVRLIWVSFVVVLPAAICVAYASTFD